MKQIKADLLPVISEEWGQEKEGEEVHYLSPLPQRCHKWITGNLSIPFPLNFPLSSFSYLPFNPVFL